MNHTNANPWLITLVGGLFFFFFFVQLVCFNPLAESILMHYHLDSTQFGRLNSAYFWAISLMALPAGILTDRFSSRRLMLSLLFITSGSLIVMAFAQNLNVLFAVRFLQGCFHAFSFLVCLKLASQWIPGKKLATASSLIMTIGLLGGGIAQPVLLALNQHFNLSTIFLLDAGLGFAITALFWKIIQDNPAVPRHATAHWSEFFSGLWSCLKNPMNSLGGIYVCLLNLPIILLGAAWGQIYLEGSFQITGATAAMIVFMMFLGIMIGSPVAGLISDRMHSRKKPMLIGALLTFLPFIVLCFFPVAHPQWLAFLFFMIGFLSSCQVIAYPMVAESNPGYLTGTGLSVGTFVLMGGNALAQIVFAFLVGLSAKVSPETGAPLYSAADFIPGMVLMMLACLLAAGLTFFLKESFIE